MGDDKVYKAVVRTIIVKGPHGPYAVAHSEELGSITFSLGQDVWKEDDRPEPGMIVMLSQVRKMQAGWRSKNGRFLQPSDEQ